MAIDTHPSSLQNIACDHLKGVGPKLKQQLEALSIYTVADLLFHLPLRYEDRTRLCAIGQLVPGVRQVIAGKIESVDMIRRQKWQLACRVSDGSGQVLLRFFHFTASQRQRLQVGQKLLCFGEVRSSHFGLEMAHPEYRHIADNEEIVLENTLTPIYPTVKGLSQKTWVNLNTQALALLQQGGMLPELFSQALLDKYKLPSIQEALNYIHKPPQEACLKELLDCKHVTQKKLILEELLAHRLALLKLRASARQFGSYPMQPDVIKERQFLDQLPFELTQAQQRVAHEIESDLASDRPMLRLVQGDVGSGKTVVAALAMVQAVANGKQVAFMAPTELLAEQHFQVLSRWFNQLSIPSAYLSGSMKAGDKRASLAAIANGAAKVIVGTHALFQKDVEFSQLALVIIDEQHRFGVHQRLTLKEKGSGASCRPHQLIMTATPIPRTLAMSAYADLDCSIIDELPPGRKPIHTVALSNTKRGEVIERIRSVCDTGQQVYWVCPLIEESELMQCQAAEECAKQLTQLLPQLSVALIHGRMKSSEKDLLMQEFKSGKINVLVATTVIEVGVDVPNATLMVIENAERLGLSQLHQLRGRVGRGGDKSFCVLLYQLPLSDSAKSRIAIMRETNDGFRIAEEDLNLRGPGEVLGTRQTGVVGMKIAHILRDKHWLNDVQVMADEIIHSDLNLVENLIDRWLKDREQFGEV